MKNQLIFLSTFLMLLSFSLKAQVRIGGDISIDVSIGKPQPGVVVVDRRPENPRQNRRVVNKPRRTGNHHEVYNYGTIRNQNGPYGLQDYYVKKATIEPLRNGLENVVYYLNTGDVLELTIATANPQDYNYHIYNRRSHGTNSIVKVLLNNKFLDLRSGSLSLQPKGNQGFDSIINLQSTYEGDFNGTVNF